jgi:hypothetical protein
MGSRPSSETTHTGDASVPDASDIVPDCRLDIKSPKIRCKAITPARTAAKRGDAEIALLRGLGLPRGVFIDRIDQSSSRSVKVAVEVLAWYFRREFGYDSIPFHAGEPIDSRDRIYLLTQREGDGHVAVGVICFRYREWTNAEPGLALAWLWINPFLRGKGILSACWPAFRGLHGNFAAEPPLSKAMEAFLRARSECWRCGRECQGDHDH